MDVRMSRSGSGPEGAHDLMDLWSEAVVENLGLRVPLSPALSDQLATLLSLATLFCKGYQTGDLGTTAGVSE